MNPLTLVKRIQSINAKEADLGISEQASWHAKYKESAYVFVGGIPYDLTEGDLLAVFAQYGEIVDVNLVRDKGTGKSKGFAFVAYEDQRSTNLAVDNLNGAQILGRIVRVDHVSKYKKKEEEDDEEEQKKREARGVCRAFQRGDCTRGNSCKFSHNEQRAANTGWGAEDQRGSNREHGDNNGPTARTVQSNRARESGGNERPRSTDRDASRGPRTVIKDEERGSKRNEPTSRDHNGKNENRSRRHNDDLKDRDQFENRDEKKSRKYESESYRREERGREKDSDSYRREERGRERDSDSYHREERGREKDSDSHRREGREKESSSHRRRGTDEENRHSSRR